jgi:hypothetical protein
MRKGALHERRRIGDPYMLLGGDARSGNGLGGALRVWSRDYTTR